jgi:hypothetical protein
MTLYPDAATPLFPELDLVTGITVSRAPRHFTLQDGIVGLLLGRCPNLIKAVEPEALDTQPRRRLWYRHVRTPPARSHSGICMKADFSMWQLDRPHQKR